MNSVLLLVLAMLRVAGEMDLGGVTENPPVLDQHGGVEQLGLRIVGEGGEVVPVDRLALRPSGDRADDAWIFLGQSSG